MRPKSFLRQPLKTMLIITSFILLPFQILSAQWQVIQSITDLNQNDVCYSGPAKIFITCDNGLLLKSENSGNTWDSFQLGYNVNLNSILFIDESVGFIAGNDGRIFRTQDGGINWSEVSLNDYFHINDLAFSDYENGICVGSKEVHIDGRTYYLPSIHITSNSGQSWTEKSFDFEGSLNSVSYLNGSTLIAVGDSGLILISTDSGSTWFLDTNNLSTNLNVIKVIPEYLTFIAGDEGTFIYSLDSGETWVMLNLPNYYHMNGGCFSEYGNIVVSGSKEVRIDGRLYNMAAILSINPEYNEWTEKFSQVRGIYNSLQFCTLNKAIAVGDSGIMAIYTSVSNAAVYDKNNPTIEFQLDQNYPNPFNPTTTIGFGIQNKSNVKITILNAIGEQVAVVLNEEKEPGYYQVEFNAVNFPSGVYFYQLRAGDFVQTKKMILLR